MVGGLRYISQCMQTELSNVDTTKTNTEMLSAILDALTAAVAENSKIPINIFYINAFLILDKQVLYFSKLLKVLAHLIKLFAFHLNIFSFQLSVKLLQGSKESSSIYWTAWRKRFQIKSSWNVWSVYLILFMKMVSFLKLILEKTATNFLKYRKILVHK